MEDAAGSIDFTTAAGYVLRRPDGARSRARSLVVILHGQGMSGRKMLDLLAMPPSDRVVIAGDGPYPFEKRRQGKIDVGYGWYIYRGDQAEFREHLERSEGHVLRLVDRARECADVDPARTVIVGYSQGGYLAGFVALRHRNRFAGLVLMSSRLKHEFVVDELAGGDLPATMFIHSAQDPAVRWEATREGHDLLVAGGADVSVTMHDEGHRIPSDAGNWIDAWLTARGI